MSIKFNRVLWLLPDNSNYTFTCHIKGLELLGANVVTINYREEVLKLGICKGRERILKAVEDFAPDLVLASFFIDTYELSPEFLREISAKSPLVLITGDDELYGTWQTIYFAQSADAVMTTDYCALSLYGEISIPAVHYFFPPLHFMDPSSASEKSIDVSFMGDCEKADRGEYINFLRENGINVLTCGRGSENGFVPREEVMRIVSQSKINLNFTKVDVFPEILKREPWRASIRQVKARPIEISKMNSFCLSEYFFGLDKMFSVGSEVDVFCDKGELLSKVKYYLKNDEEREKMASRAFDRTRKEYDDLAYLCRVFNLLYEKLRFRKRKAKQRPVFRSFDFNASEVQANFRVFVALLRLRRFVLAFGVVPYFFSFNLSCLVGLWRGVAELVSNMFCGRK